LLMVRKIIQWVPIDGTRWRNESLSMITKIMEWVSITALLLVVSWRPVASYQIPPDLVVCWGALVGCGSTFIKRELETHYDIENSPELGLRC